MVLAAEDEETDAFFLREAFDQLDVPNQLHIVSDGQEVMEFLERTNGHEDAPMPHIIFLDINMPRKNGHEVLSEIKSSDKFAHIPVVMFSGSIANDDVRQCYKNNACAYVPKARGFKEMLELVSNMEKFWFKSALLPQE